MTELAEHSEAERATVPDGERLGKCVRCAKVDNHPKFEQIVPGEKGLEWKTYHHDCAALDGHADAQVIVDAAKGAKGDDLRKILTNPKHAVHAAVRTHRERTNKSLHAAALRALAEEAENA